MHNLNTLYAPVFFMIFLVFLAGCTATPPQNTKPITYTTVETISYKILETTPTSIGIDDYKLPEYIRSLPIPIYTWYPQGTTLFLPIGIHGITGQFVWQDSCLWFKPDDFEDFVTPIFWVNSIQDIRFTKSKVFLILHNNTIIQTHHAYYLDTIIQPKNKNGIEYIIQHGDDHCLKDHVIYLDSNVIGTPYQTLQNYRN